MRARRGLLYMPGDDMHKIRKAAGLGVDCVCMDLEDGVALNRKEAARSTIRQALLEIDFGRAERLARINALESGLAEEDLQSVLPAHPDGIVVPKVEHGEQIRQVSEWIAAAERQHGWPEGEIALIAVVETARGIVNLKEIAGASPRLQALIFGAEDLAGDIGAQRTRDGWEVFYARSAIVLHAAAFGLQAIDMVYVDFHDTAGLITEARQAAAMGFAGKQLIHPAQVNPVQDAFTPDDEQIARALRITRAFEEHQRAGRGAFALDGKMVDAPVVKAAERVLERARAAGKVIAAD
ncbi:MAG: CoA ester lyase [Chloroflexi bacterium]|jgi:citrate lyase beta subunit|nr:CoA ester lyase [Chloroflexota bacterium]